MTTQKQRMLPGILTLISFCAFGQTFIQIPLGAPAIADGIEGAGEWDDAESVEITVSATKKVEVRYKHDGSNLYLAYRGSLESANIRFPELLLDPQNDKSAAWQPDDWWFHVSATDCESQGQHSVYSNCDLVQPDWAGAPNMTPGAPLTDSIEVKIPFDKVGVQTGDTVGLAFEVTNTSNAWNYWPTTAKIGQPDTWADAVLSPGPASAAPAAVIQPFRLFPNPANDFITVEWPAETPAPERVTLINAQGGVVRQIDAPDGRVCRFDVAGLPAGVYLAVFVSGARQYACNFVLE